MPSSAAIELLASTRAKAKMVEFQVPSEAHETFRDPADLFGLTIGLLGDHAAAANRRAQAGTAASSSAATSDVHFAVRFFEAFRVARLSPTIGDYLALIGSAGFYLADLPGSSRVLANVASLNLAPEAGPLGKVLLGVLLEDGNANIGDTHPLITSLNGFFRLSVNADACLLEARYLRTQAYESGTARELLLADTIESVVRARLHNSTRELLARYSGLGLSAWASALTKDAFPRELWPAQKLLGEFGILSGESAVVQMPTSAGKTRAIEMVVRSAFIAERTRMAIVVAPFRALCHEISEALRSAFRDETVDVDLLGDAMQDDFTKLLLDANRSVLVMTPEKLLFVLRQAPEIASQIGLIVYDEGHQFDTGRRGVTYELLVSSLRVLLAATAQTLLISAVLPNAKKISSWLLGSESRVADGVGLQPTERTLAFMSWPARGAQLQFVDKVKIDVDEFFVPRVVEVQELGALKGERKKRVFPEKQNTRSMALYLADKLVPNGGVAIFCGTKATAVSVAKLARDVTLRGGLSAPLKASNQEEVGRLWRLFADNLGEEADVSAAARQGVMSHHAGLPHGIRMAVEYAMRKAHVRLIVCTSTLAQGVNIPVRYLIVTGVTQGAQAMRVRDFHNLMGRTGRSGMHTEGCVVFADSDIYDLRTTYGGMRRWASFRELLDPVNSEECLSSLLLVLKPLVNERGEEVSEVNPLDLVNLYIRHGDGWMDSVAELVPETSAKRAFMQEELLMRAGVFGAIECFLMAHWEIINDSSSLAEGAHRLAEQTLAYALADGVERQGLEEMFAALANRVLVAVPDSEDRVRFSKLVFGVSESLRVRAWVTENMDALRVAADDSAMSNAIWGLLESEIPNPRFRKLRPRSCARSLYDGWLRGSSFSDLLLDLAQNGARIGDGAKPRTPKIEDVVDITEGGFGFDAMLFVTAVREFVAGLAGDDAEELDRRLDQFQSRLRNGLESKAAVVVFEAGLSDRFLAMKIAAMFPSLIDQASFVEQINDERARLLEFLSLYPSYFSSVVSDLR